MNKQQSDKTRAPLDDRTWDLLGYDAPPELDASLWPEVQRRVAGEPRGRWLPRLSFAGMGAACMVLGLWFGMGLAPGAVGTVAATEDADYTEGSFLDDDGWTLDGLYLLAEAETDAPGGAR